MNVLLIWSLYRYSINLHVIIRRNTTYKERISNKIEKKQFKSIEYRHPTYRLYANPDSAIQFHRK